MAAVEETTNALKEVKVSAGSKELKGVSTPRATLFPHLH